MLSVPTDCIVESFRGLLRLGCRTRGAVVPFKDGALDCFWEEIEGEGLDLDVGVPSVLLCMPGGRGRLSFVGAFEWTATIGAIDAAGAPQGRSRCSIRCLPLHQRQRLRE